MTERSGGVLINTKLGTSSPINGRQRVSLDRLRPDREGLCQSVGHNISSPRSSYSEKGGLSRWVDRRVAPRRRRTWKRRSAGAEAALRLHPEADRRRGRRGGHPPGRLLSAPDEPERHRADREPDRV